MRNYYNPTLKEEFVAFFNNNMKSEKYGFIERAFENSCYYETRNEKDLCNFNRDEILALLKGLNSYSIYTLNGMKAVYSRYVLWCNEKELVVDGQNHFREIKTDDLLDCINKYAVKQGIITRKELLNQIEQLPNAIDSFIILALFEGFESGTSTELVKVKLSDFNGDSVKLSSKRVIKVSSELKRWAEEASEQKKYYFMNTNEDMRTEGYALDYSPYVVRFKTSKKSTIDPHRAAANIYRKCASCFEYLGLDFCSAKSMKTSGIIHMINEGTASENITAEEYISKYRDTEIRNQYNTFIPSISGFVKQYREFLH